jgi:exopolysaccharide biosynthesis polyprenyl glycosylphosphotransferase
LAVRETPLINGTYRPCWTCEGRRGARFLDESRTMIATRRHRAAARIDLEDEEGVADGLTDLSSSLLAQDLLEMSGLVRPAAASPPVVLSRRSRRSQVVLGALLAGDLLACFLAVAAMELLVGRFESHDLLLALLIFPGFAGWSVLASIYGLYSRSEPDVGRAIDDLPNLLLLATLATWLGLVFLVETGLAHPRLRNLIVFWSSYVLALAVCRTVSRFGARYVVGGRGERTLVVGAGRIGSLVGRKLSDRPRLCLQLVGYLDDQPLDDCPAGMHLGGIEDLERVVRAHQVERVIVAFSRLSGEMQAEVCRRCLDLGVQIDIVPRLFEVIGPRTRFHSIDGIPLMSLPLPHLSRSSRSLKRSMDVVVAALSLVFLSPFFLVVAIWIRASSPGPVLFRQERMGAGGRRFQIYKFRTMFVDADERKEELAHLNKHTEAGPKMFKVPDDPRVTRVGRVLRRWSLDELPQLINVIRGEMSLVGPRPLILDEDENVRGRQRRRLRLTPGITGLWQVLGRSDIPFAEMLTLDYLYVTNWSLWGDVKLLVQTVPVVLQRRGAY